MEDPISEWGDDPNFEDDDFEDELDMKANAGLSARNHSGRPQTNKSTGSQIRGESKRLRLKQSRPVVFGFSANNLKRDPAIESIIESRKSSLIDNSYTRLAQSTSQGVRPPQQVLINTLKPRATTSQTEITVDANDKKDQIINPPNGKKIQLPPNLPFDNDKWDDGLNGEFDKGKIRIQKE
jgi:hypothetical protein